MKRSILIFFIFFGMLFFSCSNDLKLMGDAGLLVPTDNQSESGNTPTAGEGIGAPGEVSNGPTSGEGIGAPGEVSNGPTSTDPSVVVKDPTKGTESEDPNKDKEIFDRDVVIVMDNNDVIVGEEINFTISLNGDDITSSSTWNSSNGSVLKNEGNGKFSALGVGSSDVTVNYNGQSKTVKLAVHMRPDTIDGDRYSEVRFGIENAAGPTQNLGDNNEYEWYKVGNTTLYCNGDCDDAYLSIKSADVNNLADLTLGFYNDKLYLVSNKDQELIFTTYTGYVIEWGDQNRFNSNSKLFVDIKNRDDVTAITEEFVIFPEKGNTSNLTTHSIHLNKGDSIYLRSHFEGTAVDNGWIASDVEFATILKVNTGVKSNNPRSAYSLVREGYLEYLGYKTIKIAQ